MAFINISNHPSKNWSDEQIDMATQMTRDSEIVDIPCPLAEPERNKEYVISVGYEVSDLIEQILPTIGGKLDAIMVQGETTITFRLVNQLRGDYPGVPIVAGCYGGDGEFFRFREYV